MPKVSLDMPQELVDDLRLHVGDEKKFVSLADAVRTACRKLLDHSTPSTPCTEGGGFNDND